MGNAKTGNKSTSGRKAKTSRKATSKRGSTGGVSVRSDIKAGTLPEWKRRAYGLAT